MNHRAALWSSAVFFVACVQGSSPPRDPVAATFTDPDGEVWTAADSRLNPETFEGPDCATATWYQVSGGDPEIDAWFGVPEGGGAIEGLDEATTATQWRALDMSVWWGSNDPAQRRFLQGARGELIASGPNLLEYEFSSGQECTHLTVPVDGEEFLCADQVGPATMLLEGPLDEYVIEPEHGTTRGLEVATGAPVCGGEAPGTQGFVTTAVTDGLHRRAVGMRSSSAAVSIALGEGSDLLTRLNPRGTGLSGPGSMRGPSQHGQRVARWTGPCSGRPRRTASERWRVARGRRLEPQRERQIPLVELGPRRPGGRRVRRRHRARQRRSPLRQSRHRRTRPHSGLLASHEEELSSRPSRGGTRAGPGAR